MITPHRLETPIAALLALLLSACAAGPDYQRPALDVPQSFREQGVDWHVLQSKPTPPRDWWADLQDATLSALVAQANQHNQTLAQAEAAYRAAAANVQAARAQRVPTLGVAVSAQRGNDLASARNASSTSKPVSQQTSTELTASWEPDFWGKVRRDIEAGEASYAAQAADLSAQRLSIATAVVSDYLNLRQLDADIALLQQQRELNAQLLGMVVASQLRGGSAADDVLSARDALDNADIALVSSQTAREQYEHALAVLCGQAPASFSIVPVSDYVFRLANVPAAVPADLLQQRNDIIASEREVAAANAQIGVAQAAFFPSLTLSASSGYASDTFARLLSAPNLIWSLGPQLAATLLDGGARKAAVAQARANQQAASANYRQTVLSAFAEVEDDLSAWHHLTDQSSWAAAVAQRETLLLTHTRQQQNLGSASTQDVLRQQLNRASAQRNAVDAQAQNSLASVKLVSAIGGI